MSIKTTQRITRSKALELLFSEIPLLPNDTLGHLLDAVADSEDGRRVSRFDNFIVSEFADDPSHL